MTKKVFEPFSDEQQKEYEREVRLQYDASLVDESRKRWGSYSKAEREMVIDEGNAIYADIAQAIEAEKSPDSADVQALMARWHEHLRYFYEPTLDVLRGLGMMYTTHPDFIANFTELHPALPRYLEEAITVYVDTLETAEIERLLAEDEDSARASRLSG